MSHTAGTADSSSRQRFFDSGGIPWAGRLGSIPRDEPQKEQVMIGPLKRFGACGGCCAGVLAVGALAAGVGGLSAGPLGRAAAVPVAALADDGQKGHERQHPPAVQAQVDSVVQSYLTVQKLLAEDKAEGVGAELKKMREAAQSLRKAARHEELQVQAGTVARHAEAQPKDLKEARAAFKPLSSAVTGLVQIVPPTAKAAPALYEASCPMVKANWLQTGKDLANPYMGKAMLKCGSIKRTVKPPAGGQDKKEQGSTARAMDASGTAAAVSAARSCCSAAVTAPRCGADALVQQ